MDLRRAPTTNDLRSRRACGFGGACSNGVARVALRGAAILAMLLLLFASNATAQPFEQGFGIKIQRNANLLTWRADTFQLKLVWLNRQFDSLIAYIGTLGLAPDTANLAWRNRPNRFTQENRFDAPIRRFPTTLVGTIYNVMDWIATDSSRKFGFTTRVNTSINPDGFMLNSTSIGLNPDGAYNGGSGSLANIGQWLKFEDYYSDTYGFPGVSEFHYETRGKGGQTNRLLSITDWVADARGNQASLSVDEFSITNGKGIGNADSMILDIRTPVSVGASWTPGYLNILNQGTLRFDNVETWGMVQARDDSAGYVKEIGKRGAAGYLEIGDEGGITDYWRPKGIYLSARQVQLALNPFNGNIAFNGVRQLTRPSVWINSGCDTSIEVPTMGWTLAKIAAAIAGGAPVDSNGFVSILRNDQVWGAKTWYGRQTFRPDINVIDFDSATMSLSHIVKGSLFVAYNQDYPDSSGQWSMLGYDDAGGNDRTFSLGPYGVVNSSQQPPKLRLAARQVNIFLDAWNSRMTSTAHEYVWESLGNSDTLLYLTTDANGKMYLRRAAWGGSGGTDTSAATFWTKTLMTPTQVSAFIDSAFTLAGRKLNLANIPAPPDVSGADTNRVPVWNNTLGAWQLGWKSAAVTTVDTAKFVSMDRDDGDIRGEKFFKGFVYLTKTDSANVSAVINKRFLDSMSVRGEFVFSYAFNISDTSSARALQINGISSAGGVPVYDECLLVGYSYSVALSAGTTVKADWSRNTDPTSYAVLGRFGSDFLISAIYIPSGLNDAFASSPGFLRRVIIRTKDRTANNTWTTRYTIPLNTVDLTDPTTLGLLHVVVHNRRRYRNDLYTSP